MALIVYQPDYHAKYLDRPYLSLGDKAHWALFRGHERILKLPANSADLAERTVAAFRQARREALANVGWDPAGTSEDRMEENPAVIPGHGSATIGFTVAYRLEAYEQRREA